MQARQCQFSSYERPRPFLHSHPSYIRLEQANISVDRLLASGSFMVNLKQSSLSWSTLSAICVSWLQGCLGGASVSDRGEIMAGIVLPYFLPLLLDKLVCLRLLDGEDYSRYLVQQKKSVGELKMVLARVLELNLGEVKDDVMGGALVELRLLSRYVSRLKTVSLGWVRRLCVIDLGRGLFAGSRPSAIDLVSFIRNMSFPKVSYFIMVVNVLRYDDINTDDIESSLRDLWLNCFSRVITVPVSWGGYSLFRHLLGCLPDLNLREVVFVDVNVPENIRQLFYSGRGSCRYKFWSSDVISKFDHFVYSQGGGLRFE